MAARGEDEGKSRRRREREFVAGKHGAGGASGGAEAKAEMMQSLQEPDKRTNMEILHNTISKAAEATTIADATLVQLAQQREQMLRVDDDLATINQTLANCEKRIKGIQANFFTGLFVSNKGNAPQEVDTRYKAPTAPPPAKGGPSAPARKDSSAAKSEPNLTLPSHVHDSAACASDKALQNFLESQKAKLEMAKNEKVMFHYCNTRQPLVLDQTNKCIILTNQRLIRILDGNVANKVFLPEVESVRHIPAKPLGYDTLVFKATGTGKEDLVEIWNCDVATFFKNVIDLTLRDRDQRRRTRTDAELAKKSPRSEMSELERKFEEDKEQEDEQLEVLGKLVDGLGERAKAMGQELDSQKPIIDHLGQRMDATTERLDKNNVKLTKILKS